MINVICSSSFDYDYYMVCKDILKLPSKILVDYDLPEYYRCSLENHVFDNLSSDVDYMLCVSSPLSINKLLSVYPNINLYKFDGNLKLQKIDLFDNSIECITYQCFGIITSQSSFVSRYVVHLLDQYDVGDISKEYINEVFDHMKSVSWDDRQISILNDIYNKFVLKENIN